MKKLCLMLVAMMMVAVTALAQTREVYGTVISAEDEEPLVGASVVGVGSRIGCNTDIEGKFRLALPTSVTKLQVSFVGMKTAEVNITSGEMNIVMRSATNLNEVVVTGYGVQKKASFTGAATVMDGAQIEKKNDMNFVKTLEGAVPGFQYNNSTSMPGAYGSVYIRGMGSLSSSSQPLYVVDGVPVNSDYDNMSSNNNYFDPMAAYNPNDIESVTVLKDAAATSIYGSRAANGVIVITTKKGGEGTFHLNLEMKQGFSSVANNNMKFANAQKSMDFFATSYYNRTQLTSNPRDYAWCYDYMMDYLGWDGVTDTDWMDLVTRKGHFQEYNISFNGTSGNTNYYASVGYSDSKGIVIGSSNTRYSGRLNLDTKYKWFQAGVNASLSWSKFGAFSQSTGGSYTNPTVGAMARMLPFDKAYEDDGSYANIAYYNPLAVWDKNLGDLNDQTNQTFVGNPWFQLNLPFGIWAKTNFGVNLVDQNQYSYWSAVYNPQGMDYNGLGQTYISRTSTLTWTNTLGWNYTFNNKHDVSVLLGQEMQRYDYHYDYHARADFPFAGDGMRDMTTAASDFGSEYYREESRLASYFGDAHYAYDNRYYLSASIRTDGSSIFGADRRWATFWSVGGKWRISKEKFMENQTWLTNLAVRASYGTVGNQSLPSLYAARGYYAAGYNYNQSPGMIPASIYNNDLTWETSKKFDVGFDLSVFNRVNVTFDYYNDTTTDALYEVPLSMTTGMTSFYKNIGKILNRGIELSINAVLYNGRDANVSFFGSLTWNKNKVLKLADGSIEGSYTIIEEGRPYRQFYTREYAGVDPDTGKALYYLNEEGDETTDNYNEAAKRYVGSAEPKVLGAFGITANAYGFDFSMQFNYRLGNKVIDTGHNFCGWSTNSFRTPLEELVDNSWTPENHNAKYPQAIYGDPYYVSNSNYSTRWIYNGSYLRLSNLALGYTLPRKLTQKALMDKVRFFINMDNVHTWTSSEFIGYNPDTYASGVIAFQYPAAFSFTGGFQITF